MSKSIPWSSNKTSVNTSSCSSTVAWRTLLETCEGCLFTRVWAGSPGSGSETIRRRMSSSQSSLQDVAAIAISGKIDYPPSTKVQWRWRPMKKVWNVPHARNALSSSLLDSWCSLKTSLDCPIAGPLFERKKVGVYYNVPNDQIVDTDVPSFRIHVWR